jgi:energy-coupling factor transporter ATP-binding protein EcfA2
MQNSASERKPLLRISNLKQYFPLKTKGLFVKANDGITLDIYEGETLGLVGESGCGKSTFGRTLLQLYRQTDGRTMYYGASLDEIAPRYVNDTYNHLEKHIKKLHGLRIGDAGKVGIDHIVQALQQPLIHKTVKEIHLLRRVLKHIADDILEHAFRQYHIILQIGKSDLRLDHPELGRMAGRIGVFRPEGRPEGIDVFKRHRIRLYIQLTADRQVCGFSEEIL